MESGRGGGAEEGLSDTGMRGVHLKKGTAPVEP